MNVFYHNIKTKTCTQADSWPRSLDDSHARRDWGWAHKYDLDALCNIMFTDLQKKYNSPHINSAFLNNKLNEESANSMAVSAY